jgi:hypothetical protein
MLFFVPAEIEVGGIVENAVFYRKNREGFFDMLVKKDVMAQAKAYFNNQAGIAFIYGLGLSDGIAGHRVSQGIDNILFPEPLDGTPERGNGKTFFGKKGVYITGKWFQAVAVGQGYVFISLFFGKFGYFFNARQGSGAPAGHEAVGIGV